ncbi:MAG: alpha-hydroxy-acid oxidizing enzyme [Robiginitomaculum sp.]|nr:MAG: alpha-hydroxy-acid oxidizing enzyme [Robiginitomaculum sp.]
MPIKNCNNIGDFRVRAKRALPSPMFHYLDGGADDEWTMGNNSSAFDGYELLPSALVDVSSIDTKTTLFGQPMAMPLFLSPTGGTQMFHSGKELAVARAAADAGLMASLSTVGTTKIEEFAAHSKGPKLFQLYVFKDSGLTNDLISRAKLAGYDALCLTVDTPVGGNRERDLVTGMSVPPRFTPASLFSIAMHPKWVLGKIRSGKIRMENVADWIESKAKAGGGGAAAYIDARFDQSLTWEDARKIAQEWGGPFIIKGIMTPADAIRARDAGACAVMISNHGGRQLDGAPAPIDMVAPIRDAVGDSMELVVDGGVRRGAHIVKALALGADACSIGRPFLYGLAAGGEAGVARVLRLFTEEFERTMALMGCTNLAQISAKHIQRRIA